MSTVSGHTRSHSKASHAASRHPPDAPSLPAATRVRLLLNLIALRTMQCFDRLSRLHPVGRANKVIDPIPMSIQKCCRAYPQIPPPLSRWIDQITKSGGLNKSSRLNGATHFEVGKAALVDGSHKNMV